MPGFPQEFRLQIQADDGTNAVFPQKGHACAGAAAGIENDACRLRGGEIENAFGESPAARPQAGAQTARGRGWRDRAVSFVFEQLFHFQHPSEGQIFGDQHGGAFGADGQLHLEDIAHIVQFDHAGLQGFAAGLADPVHVGGQKIETHVFSSSANDHAMTPAAVDMVCLIHLPVFDPEGDLAEAGRGNPAAVRAMDEIVPPLVALEQHPADIVFEDSPLFQQGCHRFGNGECQVLPRLPAGSSAGEYLASTCLEIRLLARRAEIDAGRLGRPDGPDRQKGCRAGAGPVCRFWPTDPGTWRSR